MPEKGYIEPVESYRCITWTPDDGETLETQTCRRCGANYQWHIHGWNLRENGTTQENS
jgi:hypothetical protein